MNSKFSTCTSLANIHNHGQSRVMEMSAILSQTGGSQDETIQGTLGLVTQLPFQTAPSSSTALDVQPEGDGSVEAERRKLLGLLKVAPTSPKTRSSNVEKDIALGKHENPKNTVPINNPNEHSTNEKPNRQEEVCAIQDAKGGAPSSKVPTISQKLQAQVSSEPHWTVGLTLIELNGHAALTGLYIG